MSHLERLAQIRAAMKSQGIDAYIIPSSDPHISEYLPERYKCIAWVSGFTGSAGTLVITQDFAGLWTDARYFVQANEQLAGTGFELVKLKTQGAAEYADWLSEQLEEGAQVAFDGNLASLLVAHTVKSILEPLQIKVNGHVDLLSAIWNDRPELPQVKAFLLDESTTGQSTTSKLAAVRQILAKARVESHFISSLDDVAWLLNIRGQDVPCNPVVLSFVYLSQDKAILFIADGKLSPEDIAILNSQGVEIADYEAALEFVKNIDTASIVIDPKRTCFAIYDSIPSSVKIVEKINPSTSLKAIKNEVEINHIRQTMINDGVAMTKFFKWLEEAIGQEELSEISIAEKLQGFRAEQDGFVDVSFSTIAGYLDHGALPHYHATEQSNYTLKPEGLLLVDSGGQYKTGTTDITRVISLGNITQEEKDDYTIVLKGTIEGSQAIFPVGSKGYQIDAITRRPIWATLRNYGHGTGHGIGFFLNVHEGPHVFNPTPTDIAIEEGMITSIEPGLYREGKHGIRIENLVLAKKHDNSIFGDFMNFETLTICYIDTDLVNKDLLGQEHIDWLNDYNQFVFDKLSPHLTTAEASWLANKTKAI
ncbi:MULTISPECIES: aminopeptidase P family protein [Sphingobacterium]|uniref:Aminopeptidase P family protein n=1 Tax=Sphingobacterium litopenaei TaxID=2763500 RepID=A0ABR7YAN7_9SPHI|nr:MULTISPECIES: aminopeptidase P family protein [Sphingobacterium]MBD1428352.1 aminopeptidase P family protein [Sphingobacterium litopenaei]NGM72198.1 aminopeptidase P family protein [Sphingobacterium sp. SGL-16]